MNKRYLGKLIAYGLFQWIIFNLALFVAAMIFDVIRTTDMTAPPPLGLVIVAIVMTAVAYVFARQLKPTSRPQVLQAGIVWTAMTIIFLVVTCVANDTQSVIFGNWGVYAVFVGQLVGTLLLKPRGVTVPPVTRV